MLLLNKTVKTVQYPTCISFIENKNKHLTASDIVKYINSNEETVGMTTVYRYLDKACRNNIRDMLKGGTL